MGKIYKPVQVHWTNNVGGLVGYHAYGNHYWRANAQHVSNPNTPDQINARQKFSYISRLIAALVPAYKVGYAVYAQGRSARAEFTHQLKVENAITGNVTAGFTTDYEKVKIAKGTLLPTYNLTASVLGGQHKVSFTWTDNSGQADAENSDMLCVCLYNITKGVSMFVEDLANRTAEAGQVTYPTSWAGDTVYSFAFWHKTTGAKYCAESQLVNFFIAE